jgi:hypothetical protein
MKKNSWRIVEIKAMWIFLKHIHMTDYSSAGYLVHALKSGRVKLVLWVIFYHPVWIPRAWVAQ